MLRRLRNRISSEFISVSTILNFIFYSLKPQTELIQNLLLLLSCFNCKCIINYRHTNFPDVFSILIATDVILFDTTLYLMFEISYCISCALSCCSNSRELVFISSVFSLGYVKSRKQSCF